MDDEMNDYDKIAEAISEITSIVWAAFAVSERDNDLAKNLLAPALDNTTLKLNNLHAWVKGLSESHRAYKNKEETMRKHIRELKGE